MTDNHIEIDIQLCKGCRLCLETCPHQCIEQGAAINKIGYQYVRFEQKGCTACGFCYYICPEPGAITVIKGEKKAVDNG